LYTFKAAIILHDNNDYYDTKIPFSATKDCPSDLYISSNSFPSIEAMKCQVEQKYHRRSGIFSELLPAQVTKKQGRVGAFC